MTLPTCCATCPAAQFGDLISTDGFDVGREVYCGFTKELLDGFYEHPGAERIDREIVSKNCPLKG